jgi:hypothetical protein
LRLAGVNGRIAEILRAVLIVGASAMLLIGRDVAALVLIEAPSLLVGVFAGGPAGMFAESLRFG